MSDKLILLYDEQCILCTNTVDTLRYLNTSAKLEMLPLHKADIRTLLPQTTIKELQAQLHVIDRVGDVYKGSDAIVRILREVPSLRWLSLIYKVPGLRPFAQMLYKWVAKNRYKLFGKTDSCQSGACDLSKRNK